MGLIFTDVSERLPENKAMHIKRRLKGSGYIKAMSKAECESWYNEVFKK